jgi:hypothetical protein
LVGFPGILTNLNDFPISPSSQILGSILYSAFESQVLGRIFGPKKEGVTGA